MITPVNPFPASEFDDWAETYDASVSIDQFPFHGYKDVLAKIITLAAPRPGYSVLDLGTGTGNLGLLFIRRGCNLWGTDFSAPMLEKAQQKLPSAHLFLHDLHLPLPAEIQHPFDRIVSAYVFHHFKLEEKIRILISLLPHLAAGGRIIIGDITFPNATALEEMKIAAGEEWEEEFYWLADESMFALQKAGFHAKHMQVSSYAGIFVLLPEMNSP
jgi:cyclopropane fatty-acyl-phospholipid synthase-like methyltransferase